MPITSALSRNDTRDGALMHSVMARDIGLRSAQELHLPYTINCLLRDYEPKRDHASLGGMEVISKSGNPFEISDDIVGFVEIDVIDLAKPSRVWNERKSNEAMHGAKSLFTSAGPKADDDVSPATERDFHHSSARRGQNPTLIFAHSVQTPNAPQIAHLVKGSKFGERNRSPFLKLRAKHAAGCPSARTRSAIKNPSRAHTRGGFAVDSTALRLSQGDLGCR